MDDQEYTQFSKQWTDAQHALYSLIFVAHVKWELFICDIGITAEDMLRYTKDNGTEFTLILLSV